MAEIDEPLSADEIVRRSGSNLAFAFAVLPHDKRRDMRVFYAFCRIVDDIADRSDLDLEVRRDRLGYWRELVTGTRSDPQKGIERELVELIGKYDLPRDTLEDIISGVEMDFEQNRFETFEALKQYCYGVASAVGLISIEIFGYEDPRTRDYAEKLGYAFQLTNILRDVGEDAAEDRIYLPLEDLARFEVTEEDVLKQKSSDRFVELMRFECERAELWYREADAALPDVDRRSMRSAELMRAVYSGILKRMKADDFRVFEKRYRLGKAGMLWQLLRAFLR